jgi:hypothetical protein
MQTAIIVTAGCHSQPRKYKFKKVWAEGFHTRLDGQHFHWEHITAFFSRAEKPSEDTISRLFLINMKGLRILRTCFRTQVRLMGGEYSIEKGIEEPLIFLHMYYFLMLISRKRFWTQRINFSLLISDEATTGDTRCCYLQGSRGGFTGILRT